MKRSPLHEREIPTAQWHNRIRSMPMNLLPFLLDLFFLRLVITEYIIMYEDGVDGDSLKEVLSGACRHIDIGAAVKPKLLLHPDIDELNLDDDGVHVDKEIVATKTTRYGRTLTQEFNALVVEHHLKWAPLCVSEPGPLLDERPSERLGRYDFHHSDVVVDWALRYNMKAKGHVLVWHVTSPNFLEDLPPDQVREQLRRHIFTTMGHYRGRIKEWDVVNEALAPDGTLAENVFYRKLGPNYIEQCFRWAHEADPDARLYYNDNKVEGVGAKADGFYYLLADLANNGVPIHGCGLQAHFNAAGTGRNRPPTPRMVKNQINRLGKLGLSVHISEMDVRVSKLPPNLRQIAQRQIYRDIVAAALTEPSFDAIYLWGFTDRHTWVTHYYCDDEPLIFDDDYGRKEAYYGLREALSTLIPGGVVGGGVPLDSDVDEDGNQWGHLWMQPDPESVPQQSSEEAQSGEAKPDWLLT